MSDGLETANPRGTEASLYRSGVLIGLSALVGVAAVGVPNPDLGDWVLGTGALMIAFALLFRLGVRAWKDEVVYDV